jgi:hypothetical protein
MSRSKLKKKTGARRPKNAPASQLLDPLRAGLPALDSITGIDEFRRGKKVFRIIHTNEVDAYEQVPSKAKREKQI